MRRGSGWLLVAAFAMVAGCTGSDPGPRDDYVKVDIRAGVLVCAPEPLPDGVGRDCGDMPLPLADVVITSNGEAVWTGQTGNEGDVHAEFTDRGEFVITVSGEPWIPEEMRSGPIDPTTRDAPLTEYVYSEGLYALEWLEYAPQPED